MTERWARIVKRPPPEPLEIEVGDSPTVSERKPGCIYQHPHPDHECRNQDDMREPSPTVSEPRTPTGRQLVDDEPRLVTGEHDMRTRVLAIEAEAAQPIDVERLRKAMARYGLGILDKHPGTTARMIAAEYAALGESDR